MSNSEHKYSTHVLELVRNNGKSSVQGKVDRGFLMFDYFDILIHKELKGEEKVYSNYFSIEDTFDDDKDYKVSFKTLSLYCDAGKDTNPFVIENDGTVLEGRSTLSKIPFLGLVQISLCRENYDMELDHEGSAIDEFLKQCEAKIMEVVRGTNCFPKDGAAVMQLYRSSTTGDFCLAIRTDSVQNIYKAALALNGSQDTTGDSLKVLTYTNVGIECGTLDGKSYKTLGAEFVSSHKDIKFALRFSADRGLLTFLTKLNSDEVKYQAIKGLFGRYDYLLHINLDEFAGIYPVLCEKKFGVLEDGDDEPEDSNFVLLKVLKYPNVENINERILVDLEIQKGEGIDYEDQEKTTATDKSWMRTVAEKNEELYKQILELGKWRCYFSEEDRSFRDLHRGMVGIYKTFSAIGMEKEAYLNWLMFRQDMELLCRCMVFCFENYAESVKTSSIDEEQKKMHRRRLLGDWRVNIQAINQYTRLVQNINYQTYQSPIYEIQTQIDTEKTMIAYRQAMMSYMDFYVKSDIIKNDEKVQIVPVIYPDLSKDKVEVTAPFASQKRNGVYIKRAIMCTVPSFEYFGRLYDLLPWLLHESSHHLRVLDREIRNKFLTEEIFSEIYTYTLESSLTVLANDNLYQEAGIVLQHLIDSLVKVTADELWKIKESEKGKEYYFENFDYRMMDREITTYLKKMFYENTDGESSPGYDLKKIKEKVFQFYLGEYRKAGMLSDERLDEILKVVSEDTMDSADKLAEDLLEYDLRQLESVKAGAIQGDVRIGLETLKGGQKWFDKRLLEINESLCNEPITGNAVREYLFHITEIYKIVSACNKASRQKTYGHRDLRAYLEKAFDYYLEQNEMKKWEQKEKLLRNPKTMHVLRRLGLLDKEKDVFCSEMEAIFHKISFREAIEHKKSKLTIYTEAFADLLMVTSLNINSFGYCRQVLQAISDAQTDLDSSWRDAVNIRRFQIVAAVLLDDENAKSFKAPQINQIKLDGTSLIDQGIIYCEYTLNCIYGKLMKSEEISGDAEKEEMVEYFLSAVKSQLEIFLKEKGRDETYYSTYLYIVLHGVEKAHPMMAKQWEEDGYEEIRSACEPVNYIFWRLECFCCGLKNILQDTEIVVSFKFFEHMREIRKTVRKQDGSGGCLWEADWECLAKPKLDVGRFYNDPKLVYEKTSPQKLENTIEFIQNYYYYNRFQMARAGGINKYEE